MSHPYYSNCRQCHVDTVNGSPIPADQIAAAEIKNEFIGVQLADPGSRAMSGALPMIPHTLHLRHDYFSCHGLIARPGL
jgi:nitrate reductase (cytochrome), electron transfer subunit